MALGVVAVDPDQLETGELEAAFLVARDDPADQLALDAVGLDEDEGSFGAWHVYLGYGRAGPAGLYRMGPVGSVGRGFAGPGRRVGDVAARLRVAGLCRLGALGRLGAVGGIGGLGPIELERRRGDPPWPPGTRPARRPARSGPRPPG